MRRDQAGTIRGEVPTGAVGSRAGRFRIAGGSLVPVLVSNSGTTESFVTSGIGERGWSIREESTVPAASYRPTGQIPNPRGTFSGVSTSSSSPTGKSFEVTALVNTVRKSIETDDARQHSHATPCCRGVYRKPGRRCLGTGGYISSGWYFHTSGLADPKLLRAPSEREWRRSHCASRALVPSWATRGI